MPMTTAPTAEAMVVMSAMASWMAPDTSWAMAREVARQRKRMSVDLRMAASYCSRFLMKYQTRTPTAATPATA